ncbi:hypothetical protein IPJ72_07050 [Candidatus Peregrinibacteria bacterium]|nr:MAG: hypothetical protein IPJ72_07050 [Candidatus Peregrinibacteria bacterium]
MFKKPFFHFFIGGILLVVGSMWLFPSSGASNVLLPYPNVASVASQESCQQRTANEMTLMRDAWLSHLNQLLASERAASDLVDDGFESLRTYRCWLDYLCESVLISGSAASASGQAGSIASQLRTLPGCESPEAVSIPGTSLGRLNQCQGEAANPLTLASLNYTTCKQMVSYEFSGVDVGDSSALAETFKNQSGAFVTLESKLKATHGRQTNRILSEKLGSLLNKMHGMESHVNLLRDQLKRLNGRIPCFINRCD